jgi:cobalt-zinc-cadmium efflux system outer membrane protein
MAAKDAGGEGRAAVQCHRLPILALGLAALAAVGCAQVRPQADYNRAADQVRLRVPATQVYSPAEPPVSLPPVRGTLTLDEALQHAMLANRDLQAAFADIGIARADLVQSGLWKNPTLSLAGMLPEGGGRADVTFGLAQDIADLWQIPIRKKIAQAALDEAVLEVVNQAVELAMAVKQAYHRVQYQRQAIAIAQSNIEIVQRSDEAALARFRAGQVGKIDVDLARAAWLQARLALIDIERQARVSEQDLALAMGLDRWPAQEVMLDPLPAAMPPAPAVDAAVELALADRSDLLAQRRAVAVARRRIREEWRKVFPSVEIGLELERMEARAMPGRKVAYDTLVSSAKAGELTLPDIQPRADRQREKRQMIDAMLGPGLMLPLPIFDQNQAQIARAMIQHRQEISRYEGLVQRVERDVRAAAINYQAATQTVQFYESQLMPQLQSSLESATAGYRSGGSTILAVLDAQRSLVMSAADLNMARMERLLAADELERAVGGPLLLQRLQAAASQPAEVPATQPANPTVWGQPAVTAPNPLLGAGTSH